MKLNELHPWPTTVTQARELQDGLAEMVIPAQMTRLPRRIAGAVVEQDKSGDRLFAAVVVLDASNFSITEVATHVAMARFPFLPGYLSFREMPPLLEAFRNLKHAPDVVICNRHGYAHPRRIGLASHLGLWLGVPTIGCCPVLLMGEPASLPREQGATAPVLDETSGEIVGLAVRTRAGVAPMYVSSGHRMTLPEAAAVVLAQCFGRRIPVPLKLAATETMKLQRTMGHLDHETEALVRRGAGKPD